MDCSTSVWKKNSAPMERDDAVDQGLLQLRWCRWFAEAQHSWHSKFRVLWEIWWPCGFPTFGRMEERALHIDTKKPGGELGNVPRFMGRRRREAAPRSISEPSLHSTWITSPNISIAVRASLIIKAKKLCLFSLSLQDYHSSGQIFLEYRRLFCCKQNYLQRCPDQIETTNLWGIS